MSYVKIPDENACWLWTGSTDTDGYGHLTVDGKLRIVSRLSWEFFRGPIPPGKSVLHSCDNPPCPNPEHLFLGTQQDNIKDGIAKNRIKVGVAGQRAVTSKFSADDIREMFRLAPTMSHGALGKKFSTDASSINKILKRQRYKWVTI